MRKIGSIVGSVLYLNALAFAITILAYLLVYKGLWKISPPAWVRGPGFILLVVLAVAILLVHEAIHMLVANLLTGGAGASLRIRALTWECRLKIPLCRNHYVVYALAPGLTLSLLGIALFYAFANPDLKFLSAIIFIAGISSAGGDYWFVAKVLQYPRQSFVLDRGIEVEIITEDEQ